MQKSTHTRQYRDFLDGLIQARKDAELTQQQVADRLDRPQSFVAKYENGERRLDVVEFLEIASLLDTDPHDITHCVYDGAAAESILVFNSLIQFRIISIACDS